MTHYQELHFRDLATRVSMPEELKVFINFNESFSCSGHPSKGEGGDFILEAKNRRTKMWMPPGIPTEDRWLRVCRNQDRLEKIKQNLTEIIGMTDTQKDDIYHCDLSEETFQWRTRIRSLGYLDNPQEPKSLCGIRGEELDHDLINFSVNAKENFNSYVNDYQNNVAIGKGAKLQPLFVLRGDREKFFDISRKNKSTPEKEIMALLNEIDMTSEGEVLRTQWKKEVKKGNKNDYIVFYRELSQAVDEATSNVEEFNGDDSEM